MNKRSKILIALIAIITIESRLFAQQIENKNVIADSVNNIEINPTSISFSDKLYAVPKISVMGNGNIGAKSILMIRGVNSINLTSSPLIYIDGIPLRYSGANPNFLSTYEPDRMGFLNSQDIMNISIFPSGNGIPNVGGRGANGIIDIDTERGEFGGTKVNFSANYGINNLNYNVSRLDADGMKSYLWSRFAEEGMTPQQLDQNPLFMANNAKYNFQTDWLDLIQRKGLFQDYHLKLKGGDGDANYLFAIGYTNKEGTIKNTDFDRIGLRFNLDYQLSPNISIYNNLSYTNTSGHYKEFGIDYSTHPIYVASAKAPFFNTHFINEDGSQSKILADVDTLGFSNPLALINDLKNKNQYNRIDGVMGINWKVAKDLSLSSDISVSYFNLSEKHYRPSLGIVPDLYRIRQNAQRSSSEFFLNWNTHLSKSGRINQSINYVTDLHTAIETYEEKSIYGRKINAGTDDFETLEQGIVDSSSNTRFRTNLLSSLLMGRISWDDRFSLKAFVNLQGVSNLGEHGRWNLYPGFNSSFAILGTLSDRKLNLEFNYDRTGNHEVRGFYQYSQYYPVNYFGYGGVYLGNIANPNLRPEITDNYELQTSFSPFGSFLAINLGYYYKLTSDLITHKSLIKELGTQGRYENAGEISNQGLELSLSSQLIRTKYLNWGISASLSTLKNEVKSLPNGDIEQSIGQYTGIAREGESLGSFYGYKVLGVFVNDNEVNLNKSDGTRYRAGDYIVDDQNNDGKINSLDKQVIGTALPKLFGYFSTQLNYKKIGFSALFNFSKGADIYNSFRQDMHVMKTYANQNPSVLNRWKSSNEVGNGLSRSVISDPSNNGAQSSLWVEDGSYLKLKSISLDYDLIGTTSQKFFKNIKVYVTGENLFTWTSYTGFDPEINSLSNALLRNIDFGAPGLGRTYRVGFNASF